MHNESFEIQYDQTKNIANRRKHQGSSLADAEPVFYDDNALTLLDRDHNEQRWIIMGKDALD